MNAHSPKITRARKLKPSDVKLIDEAERLGLLDGSNGELTFWPRSLLQVTLPHSDPGDVPVWGRRSGDFYLTVEPGHALDRAGKAQSFGYPYGSIPRLVCAYFNSQVKRQKSKRIDLGPSLADFMEQLGLGPYMTGGANGSITRLKRQVLALANARIALPDGMMFGLYEDARPFPYRPSVEKGAAVTLNPVDHIEKTLIGLSGNVRL